MPDAPETVYPSDDQVLTKPQFSSSPELKVRTMASDLASVAAGNVTVPRGEVVSGAAVAAFSVPKQNFFRTHSRTILMVCIGVGIAGIIGVLWFIAYYAVRPLFEKNPISVTTEPVSVPEIPQPEPVAKEPEPFTHHSFFRTNPNGVLDFVFSVKPASTVAEIESFQEKFARALKGVGANRLIEIAFLTDEGLPYTLPDFFDAAGLGVIPRAVLSDAFDPDFTGFVFRDTRGIWPGYLLKLKAGKTKNEVQERVARLESSPLLSGFFLGDPGTKKDFISEIQGDHTVRIARYSRTPSVFIYSWLENEYLEPYLILSVSEEGLRRAADLLKGITPD